MRTGPFSDPVVATLLNRYFVPVHLDNVNGAGERYDMPPGHEDAYMILETPEIPGGSPVETLILGRIAGVRGPRAAKMTGVLDPQYAKRELVKFLARHPELDHAWPEIARVKDDVDPASRARHAELLLDEGRVDRALEILGETTAHLPEHAVLRGRAYRLQARWSDAAGPLDAAPHGPERHLEEARIAFGRGESARATELLDRFLEHHPDLDAADEAFYLRGWLHFEAGATEEALAVWRKGIELHPLAESFFSQKAQLTLIRQNWSLDTVTDDEDEPEQ